VPMGAPVAVSGGQWTHTIELQSAGEYQLEARGLDDAGVARILATASLVVEAECPDVPEPDPLPPDDDVDPDVIPPSDDGGLIDRGCLCGTGGSDFPLGIAMFVLLAVRPRRRRG
nr:hypothetical protein [Deltaproteobacteria bacterium]